LSVPLIALVGLPGSGKSTVGRQLARRLLLRFADSDHVIEDRLGCSIREYFDREGEDRFRDVEQAVLDDLTQSHQGVLATGGALSCGRRIVRTCILGGMWSTCAPHPKRCFVACGTM
jgi:shikimate kinase